MAYTKIPETVIAKVERRYGVDSPEAVAIKNIQEARMPFECIASILGIDPTALGLDLRGGARIDDAMHNTVINLVNTLLPQGIARGVFPCKDIAITGSVLALLVDNYSLTVQINNLQQMQQTA